jgi:hypothetical protein
VPPPSYAERGFRAMVNVKSVVSWCTSRDDLSGEDER